MTMFNWPHAYVQVPKFPAAPCWTCADGGQGYTGIAPVCTLQQIILGWPRWIDLPYSPVCSSVLCFTDGWRSKLVLLWSLAGPG